jgi:Fe-S cluster assembly iron-binding protein IscA
LILNFILHINLIDEKGKFDEMIEDKGVKILIDPKALMHVIGTKMDFVDDKLRYNTIFLRVIYLFFWLGELGEGEGLGG